MTDGGLHHHLAASGDFGQVLRENYPVLIRDKVRGEEREVVSIVGPLCTSFGLLADRMEMAAADMGAWVVVIQSRAYRLTDCWLRFLSRARPAGVLL